MASVGTQRDALKAKLAKREPISSSDKLWLDNLEINVLSLNIPSMTSST